MDHNPILIIAEHAKGRLAPVSFELVALAKKMCSGRDVSPVLVIIGDALDQAAQTAAEKTGAHVLYLRVPGLEHYNSEVYKDLISAAVSRLEPSFIICPHSSEGLDYAPGLAVRCDAACITAVNGLSSDDQGAHLFSRAICNGHFNTVISSLSRLTVLTVLAGAFTAEGAQGPQGMVTTETCSVESRHIQVTGMEESKDSSSELSDAKVIVAAGRGIGSPENLEVIRRFASFFPGSAVAGSRPLIDMKWMEYRYQVGITGTTVSPQVYIACGISGSSQHIAGMNTSDYVIAINTDPHAAIFNVSDLCIVDDIIAFVEAFENLESPD